MRRSIRLVTAVSLRSSRHYFSSLLSAKGKPSSGDLRLAKARGFHTSRSLNARPRADPKKKDYYEVLGVDKNVSKADLKKAYFQLAQKHHPDKNPDDKGAQEKFAEISSAYEVLADDARRKAYDQYGHEAEEARQQGGEGFTNASDLFAELFGRRGAGGGGGGNPFESMFEQQEHTQPQRGADIHTQLKISFMESVTGCSKTFTVSADVPCGTCSGSGNKVGTKPIPCKRCKGTGTVTAQQMFFQMPMQCPSCDGQGSKGSPCPPCKGTGLTKGSREVTMKIPAGVEKGKQLRIKDHGHAGPQNSPKGHLYVTIQVENDPVFTREGNNVHVNVPISLATAVLGGKVTVPSLNGDVILKVQPGTQPEEKVVMRGKGIQQASTGETGHQYIHYKVEIPKHLTPQQQKLMEDFAATDPSFQKKT